MKRTENPYDYPFLGYSDIMKILRCGKRKAYEIINDLKQREDDDGNLIIDPSRMPPLDNIVPTDIFCKIYRIPKKYMNKKCEIK